MAGVKLPGLPVQTRSGVLYVWTYSLNVPAVAPQSPQNEKATRSYYLFGNVACGPYARTVKLGLQLFGE